LKKILLVNPWIEDVSAYDYWLKPVGLLYISSMLRSAGIEPVLIDCLYRHDPDLVRYLGGKIKDRYYGTGNFYHEVIQPPESMKNIPRLFKRYGLPEELFRKKLRELKDVDAVFVTSMMTYWHYGVSDTIRVIKEELPEIPVVLGGVYASILPEHAKNHSGADFVSPGTGIVPVKRALHFIGIDVDLNDNWLDDLSPDYSNYPELNYVVLITSTGCPFRCSYCTSWKLWERFNQKSPEKTLEEIEHLNAMYGLSDVVFFDDAILIGQNFKTLLKMIKERGFNLRFHLPNGIHARLVDEELAVLMKETNFKTIKLGYETANDELQLKTGGKVSNEEFIKAVNILKAAGFTAKELSAYIIANLPGQTFEDVERAINHCEELGVIPNINEYTPIPGTPEWRELVDSRRLPAEIDPLLLDNSLLPYWWEESLSIAQLKLLKEKSWRVKERLLSHV